MHPWLNCGLLWIIFVFSGSMLSPVVGKAITCLHDCWVLLDGYFVLVKQFGGALLWYLYLGVSLNVDILTVMIEDDRDTLKARHFVLEH